MLHQAHNLEVLGSNPSPATYESPEGQAPRGFRLYTLRQRVGRLLMFAHECTDKGLVKLSFQSSLLLAI